MLNGMGLKSQFTEFWDITAGMLNNITATDSRRSSETLYSNTADAEAPKSRELSEFYQDILDALPEGTSYPKYRWFKYQFDPVNALRRAPLKHTGRFSVVFRIQGHHLRKHHMDARYGAELQNNWKLMLIKLLIRKYAAAVFSDCKKKIIEGEPGFAVAAASRNRRAVMVAAAEAADHDTGTKFSIIPFFNFFTFIPESYDEEGVFYRRIPYVHL